MRLDKEAIRKKIEAEIVKVQKDIEDLADQTKPVGPENAIGRVSRMDAINNKGVIEASLHQAKETLAKLESALAKVNETDFGICTGCQQPIPPGRLMLMPHATRCVKCSA